MVRAVALLLFALQAAVGVQEVTNNPRKWLHLFQKSLQVESATEGNVLDQGLGLLATHDYNSTVAFGKFLSNDDQKEDVNVLLSIDIKLGAADAALLAPSDEDNASEAVVDINVADFYTPEAYEKIISGPFIDLERLTAHVDIRFWFVADPQAKLPNLKDRKNLPDRVFQCTGVDIGAVENYANFACRLKSAGTDVAVEAEAPTMFESTAVTGPLVGALFGIVMFAIGLLGAVMLRDRRDRLAARASAVEMKDQTSDVPTHVDVELEADSASVVTM
ncbi:hypothetical protein SPRG_04637 [Saprolegnia parasitica CBS 223.65]|uniref:Uncharacterized protein n=1 Tax=Saprolegnia parasitica (strain CBS 223.65) TaxID=695850 RepID=A0A067CW55_SAPPC|nr:hypothetical protein SPRG_04637 [Saprolegnia parasitica CBS 223.65]KDO30736.1 hypothetical protein SPRG_04637 [Saprolegnia parasitica CBS 223.65]|eukprot:XP_012198436.1 hypothetical protein SPRG_04637 [Saprolegnia parasitica CBS 223.65]